MLPPAANPFTVTSRREVYRNPWSVVLEDRMVDTAGQDHLYGYFAEKHFAIICPLHADGTITLVRQWRHAFGCSSWELPCGACDDDDPATAARRELAEETGLTGGRWTSFTPFHNSDARVAGRGHAFLVEEPEELAEPPAKDQAEIDMITARIPFDAAVAACDDGTIVNVATAWLVYRVARLLAAR